MGLSSDRTCNASFPRSDQIVFLLPLVVILWDGRCFQFFKFDGTTKPYTCLRGALPGDPLYLQRGITFPVLVFEQSSIPFLRALRRVFYLLLHAYIWSLEAWQVKSDLDWGECSQVCEEAFENSRIDDFALQAQKMLGRRYVGTSPSLRLSLIFFSFFQTV